METKWKCEDCDAVTNENDLGVIWGKGNWGDESCCPECRSINLKEDGKDT